MTVQVRQAAAKTGIEQWLEGVLPRFSQEDATLVERAARLAQSTLLDTPLDTGESMANHAREAAGILADLPMDAHSTAAGLLAPLPAVLPNWHEVLKNDFGDTVTGLVEGVHRMAHIQALRGQVEEAAGEERAGQLEALRKMLLAMVQDIRVVVIKLADQTQHLRYLAGRGDEATRIRAARDTMDLFAPLANRLGVWQLKWELEDLAFRCRDPETYKRIARELDEKRADRERFIAEVTDTLRAALRTEGIRAEVTGRPKHIYSIYKKLQRKDLTLKDLFDVRGVRILVEDTKDCYAALGMVHSLWTPLPKEFDDYIAKPKPNNYRSLHTAVVGPNERVLEVQIRTHEMHKQCELGVAAHWRYKEGGRREGGRDTSYDDKIAWLRQILDWREGLANAGDLASHFRTELFDDTIYVLTPQGRVVDLPRGATPVDFAYHVHTELGHRCRGARVNGAMVSLNHALDNGQSVEIIAAKSGGPSRDWLNPELGYVASGRARAKVRQWFNAQNHEAAVAQGRQWVEKELHRLGLTALNIEALAQSLELAGVEALYLAAGRGDLQARAFDRAARALRAPAAKPVEALPELPKEVSQGAPAQREGILVVGVDRLLTSLARCCKPLPPDPIIGFVTRGRGVTIHRRDCSNAARMAAERRVDAQWGARQEVGRFSVDLEIHSTGDSGALRDVLDLLTRERVALLSSNSTLRGLKSRFTLTIEVADGEALERVLQDIARLPSVVSARRC